MRGELARCLVHTGLVLGGLLQRDAAPLLLRYVRRLDIGAA